jgi:hypothetical protein
MRPELPAFEFPPGIEHRHAHALPGKIPCRHPTRRAAADNQNVFYLGTRLRLHD